MKEKYLGETGVATLVDYIDDGLDTKADLSSLATVATSGSYNDLINKPTIPTVNNATLTITQGGVTKGTFTANASSDTTIALDAGGGGGGGTYTAGSGIDITSNTISRSYINTTNSSDSPSITITGNQIIKLTSNSLGSITVSSVTDSDLESVIYFTSSTNTTISFPNNVTVYGSTTLEANTAYAVAIKNLSVVIAPESGISVTWSDISNKPSFGTAASANKGVANGVAELDANGKVPSSQLPAYVDDVLTYTARSGFPATGSTGIIYIETTYNKTYRWNGSDYTEISPSIALGETSSTAYRGDRGATAYNHATDSNKLTTAQSAGLYKFSTTTEGHIAGVNAVVKSDITSLGIASDDVATVSSNGLMSSIDKQKLDSLGDASGVVVESYARSGQTELSSTWLATGSASGTVITPDSSNLYVLMNNSTNYSIGDQFRWGGTAYVKVASIPALATKADKTNIVAGTVGADMSNGAFKIPIITATADGTISAKSEVSIPDVRFVNASQSVSGSATLSFSGTRNYKILTTSSSAINLAISASINTEHYALIKNTGSSECTVTIASISYGETSPVSITSNVYVPSDAIKIPAGKAIELGVYIMYNTTIGSHAVITCSQTLTT